MGLSGFTILFSPLRRSRFLLVAPLVAMPMLFNPAAAQAAPATAQEMNLYTRIASVNVCIARSAGVEFDKAVGIAGETIAQLILGLHKGEIQQVGTKALSIEDLRKGSVNSVLIGISQMCPDSMPAEVRDQVQKAIKGAAKPGKAQ